MIVPAQTIEPYAVNSRDPDHFVLETFPNPESMRAYSIRMRLPEFTCLCPRTGQPDFAVLYLEYIPDKLCIELKSLKNYIWSFRDKGVFHEAVTNQILGELAAAVAPHFMRLTADFNVRGGIYTSVIAEHRRPGWQAEAPVHLPARGPDQM
jgi:7-cyano-7-deazaguanine reductase